MTDRFENPIGLDGFEFVEFSAPAKGVLEPVFEAMGFIRMPNVLAFAEAMVRRYVGADAVQV